MTSQSSAPRRSKSRSPDTHDDRRPARRLGRVPGSTVGQEIAGVAMVGLLGGGPRLAFRAARVLLEDGYASRSPERWRRAHGPAPERSD